jgi:hypothetical protein
MLIAAPLDMRRDCWRKRTMMLPRPLSSPPLRNRAHQPHGVLRDPVDMAGRADGNPLWPFATRRAPREPTVAKIRECKLPAGPVTAFEWAGRGVVSIRPLQSHSIGQNPQVRSGKTLSHVGKETRGDTSRRPCTGVVQACRSKLRYFTAIGWMEAIMTAHEPTSGDAPKIDRAPLGARSAYFPSRTPGYC